MPSNKFKFPDELFRVDYPRSRTDFSNEGFSARDTAKVYGANELIEFRQAIENQFTWSC